MRSFYSFIIAIIVTTVSMQSICAEGLYKWKDARGHIQYGDKRPDNVKVENFKMPEITVIEGFRDQWKPLNPTSTAAKNTSAVISTPKNTVQKKKVINPYKKFSFIAPRNNQVMKSSFNGSVSAMLSIKPPLKKGHKIVFLLDDNKVSKSTARTKNFNNLKRGTHIISANIIDRSGRVVMTSSDVSFKVMR